jgi:periplasmic protein CpxP/Spy
MKIWKSAVATTALSLAAMVGVANAQQPPRHGEHQLEFMTTALDLTDAQVAQIKQIQAQNHASTKADHQQMKALHEQLQAIVTSDNFDEAKAQSVIAQIEQAQSTRMLEHAREMNAIYKVLNPQQKVKAVKLFGEMHGMGAHHGGPGADAPAPAQD